MSEIKTLIKQLIIFKNFPVHMKRIQIEFARPHVSDGIWIQSSTQGLCTKMSSEHAP